MNFLFLLKFFILTVKPGDDVILSGHSSRGRNIIWLEWTRVDLTSTRTTIFFYRGDGSYESLQHPTRGPVLLMVPDMKDGNVSVILKNVTINDTGIYECRILDDSKGPQLINTIHLKVEGEFEW